MISRDLRPIVKLQFVVLGIASVLLVWYLVRRRGSGDPVLRRKLPSWDLLMVGVLLSAVLGIVFLPARLFAERFGIAFLCVLVVVAILLTRPRGARFKPIALMLAAALLLLLREELMAYARSAGIIVHALVAIGLYVAIGVALLSLLRLLLRSVDL